MREESSAQVGLTVNTSQDEVCEFLQPVKRIREGGVGP